MYTVALIAKEGYEIKSITEKSLALASHVFEVWLKEDAFNGEILLLWDNNNLIKQINVCKKTDWRVGETFTDVNDYMFAKDARKYHRKMMAA